jgi:hypothetical protein
MQQQRALLPDLLFNLAAALCHQHMMIGHRQEDVAVSSDCFDETMTALADSQCIAVDSIAGMHLHA